MRNLFHSKNHKKEESVRLQHELQLEEDRLFEIEKAKRELLRTRDEEFAKRLQQQLELEEGQSSPSSVPLPPPPEQRRPRPQPEPLTDEEFARRLHEQLNAEEEYGEQSRSSPPAPPAQHASPAQHAPPAPPMQQQVGQVLSDEEYARRLQEQFESEERELERQRQLLQQLEQEQGQQPASPQQHQQYAIPMPALPPRDPAYSSGTTMSTTSRPSFPSKPVAYHQHSSSVESFSLMARPPSITPSLTPSTSYNTTNWAHNAVSSAGQQQHQSLFTTTTASPSVQQPLAVNMGGVGNQSCSHLQGPSSPTAYHPLPQASSPPMSPSAPSLTAPFFVPMAHSPPTTVQQQQHQSYDFSSSSAPLYPVYNNPSPVPTHQQAYVPQPQPLQTQTPGSPLTVNTAVLQSSQTSTYYNHVSPELYPQYQTQPPQLQHPTYPQISFPPGTQSAGTSVFTSTPSPNNPVMFVIPTSSMEPGQAQYQGGQSQHQIPDYMTTPTLEQHTPPVKEQLSSTINQYPYLSSESSPEPEERAPVQQCQSPVQHRQSAHISTKGKGRYRDPTPPPTRFTQPPPPDDDESVSHYPSATHSRPDSSIMADPYVPPPSVTPDREHRRAQDPFADDHKADEDSSAGSEEDGEDEEREEDNQSLKMKNLNLEEKPPVAFFQIKTRSTSPGPIQTPADTTPPQQEQEEFNPADYVHEEDLIDLNDPKEYDSDDDGSSDDGSTNDDSAVMDHSVLIPIEPVQVAIQTDPVSVRSSVASKTNLNLMDNDEANDPPKPSLQSTKEEIPPIDVETQKKDGEVKAAPRDNRAEIQRRLAEQMKKQGGFTRVDPTFGMRITPPPLRPADPSKLQGILSEQERVKSDKVSEDMEQYHNTPAVRPIPAMATTPFIHAPPMHTPSQIHTMYDQHTHSASSLTQQTTGHLQHQRLASPYVSHGSYDGSYMAAPMVYPENFVMAGAPPPGVMPPTGPVETTNEVQSGEYGYYLVGNSEPAKEDKDKPTKPTAVQETNKNLPKLPNSDPNHRHITVPSVNVGQRVWIRVTPTDSGKKLAERIHVVATYKTKKILSIKSTNGRQIPLDDTPVFQDWNEIVQLEDGAPWEVEWGPLDYGILSSIDLFKQIKASLRSKD